MPRLLSIGEFSRITHLSVKTLRHYDEVGLLAPLRVDETTGYRSYAIHQLPTAQVIRRLRALEMSVPDVKALLDSPSVPTRHALLARHLLQREAVLRQAQETVDTLRALLQREARDGDAPVTYRSVAAGPALAIRAVVDHREVATWWQGALGELRATLRARALHAVAPVCGQYDASLFTDERGEALVFVPVRDERRHPPVGRVSTIEVPAAELAVMVHRGPHDDVDVTYADLARHVVARELAVEGPIRETYVRDPIDFPDPADWVTEIGWPIFRADP